MLERSDDNDMQARGSANVERVFFSIAFRMFCIVACLGMRMSIGVSGFVCLCVKSRFSISRDRLWVVSLMIAYKDTNRYLSACSKSVWL